eukprot:39416-Eustigmatos_ZCMA.PRE.1
MEQGSYVCLPDTPTRIDCCPTTDSIDSGRVTAARVLISAHSRVQEFKKARIEPVAGKALCYRH